MKPFGSLIQYSTLVIALLLVRQEGCSSDLRWEEFLLENEIRVEKRLLQITSRWKRVSVIEWMTKEKKCQ